MEQLLSRLTAFSLEAIGKMASGQSLTYQRCLSQCPKEKSKFLFLLEFLLKQYKTQVEAELSSLNQTNTHTLTIIEQLKNQVATLPTLSIEEKRNNITKDILENRKILEDIAQQTQQYLSDLSETITSSKQNKALSETFPAITNLFDSLTQGMEDNIAIVSVMDSRFSAQLQNLANTERMSDTEIEFKIESKINYLKELLSTQEANLADIDNSILNRSKDLDLIENIMIKLNQ